MSYEVILNLMKKMSLPNVRNHRNFHENRFINEYARKKKLKCRSFKGHRRTYVLNKNIITINLFYLEN